MVPYLTQETELNQRIYPYTCKKNKQTKNNFPLFLVL